MTRPPNMTNSIGMELTPIKAGSFLMGSPENEPGRMIDEKEHLVTITNNFAMQNTLVTLEQWRIFINETGYKTEAETGKGAWIHIRKGFICLSIYNKLRLPYLPEWNWKVTAGYHWDKPAFKQSENHPVTCITWHDTLQFTKWLSQKENKQYRLPTEAEWEYSCRAGSKTAYSFGTDISHLQANFSRSDLLDTFRNFSGKRTNMVKKLPANNWNIYDMHGNVWEWCLDKSDGGLIVNNDTYQQNTRNPLCNKGQGRILRGGSWAYGKSYCRSSHRRSWAPDRCASGIGFRVVMDS